MTKRFCFHYVMLGLIALGAAACSSGKDGEKQNTTDQAVQADEKPKVKLAQVTERDVDQIEEYTATVESDVKNNISSNAALRIEKVLVDVGDAVKKGQVLVKMDASNLVQLDLQIKNQEIEFKRIDELYKVGGASKSEWDNIKTQLDVNRTAYNTMKENTQLISPINGVVTARNYDDGDMASTSPILTVETLAPVKMLVNVSETYYPKVKKGMPVSVKLDTYGDEVFAGKVSIVYPTIDPATHTFPVEIQLANADQRVRPGMFARATLTFGVERRTVIPDMAIVKQMGAGDYYVFIYETNGTVTRSVVKLGRRMGNEYEVISGVPAGSRVVIAGQNKLANKVAVDVVK